LGALLDVHLMLLEDETLSLSVKHWIETRLYNAEWALSSQMEVIGRQFDEMEDAYLRERKADLEQVTERILHFLKGGNSPVVRIKPQARPQQELQLGDTLDVPLVLVAHRRSVHFVAWLTLRQRHCGLFADGQFLRQLDQAV